VNRSQVDRKRKTCHIRTWRNLLFLDISSTNIDTLVPSLYQWVEPRSIEVFWVASATSAPPFLHLRLSNVLERISQSSCEPLYATNTAHRKQETFFMNILCIKSFCPQKRKPQQNRCSSVLHSSSMVAILTTETSLWTCVCASATYSFKKYIYKNGLGSAHLAATYSIIKLDCAAT
jgi:hypothetical protein